MAKETTNQGYIDAQAYATDPDNVTTPDSLHQEYERGINSYSLSQDGDSAKLNSIMSADTVNNRIGINTATPSNTLHVQAQGEQVFVQIGTNTGAAGISLYAGGQATPMTIQENVNRDLVIVDNATEIFAMRNTGEITPGADNTQSSGSASFRWSEVFAGNGTINTSDSREKTIQADDSKVLDAVDSISIKAFKWNDAIAAKGDDARIHYGVMAQEVKSAFEAQGLVAEDYGVLCYDEWTEETDEEGNVTKAAGNRYGVRYDQLYALKVACLERKIAALTP